MGAITTAALAIGGGLFAKKLLSGVNNSSRVSDTFSSPAPLPQAPKVEASEVIGEEAARRRKSAMTKTIYSSPLGAAGEASIAKKTLLGQ